MIRRTHTACGADRYLTAFGLNPRQVIYFDIETTGFRASSSSLYMIGWAVLSDMSGEEWTLTQLLAQSHSEEVLLLELFQEVLRKYDTIIEFNGDRFDLPYLREKCASYGLCDPFSHAQTVDLYRLIRPYKSALGLTRLNQKSVEQFLGIHRSDPYSGGELIDVYRSVRDHRCPDEDHALDQLFLHNQEDLLGMLMMTPLLAYDIVLRSTSPVSVRMSEKNGEKELEASFCLDASLPRPVRLNLAECCDITLCEETARVTIRLLAGCLYHFFPDWKNYCFLPAEDMAVHKSVASFVDPSHRENARPQNCYVKKEGVFLPHPSGGDPPFFHTGKNTPVFFQRYYKDPVIWTEYQPDMDPDTFSAYIHFLVERGILS